MLITMSIYSFIPHKLTDHLLCARYCLSPGDVAVTNVYCILVVFAFVIM